MLNDDGKLIGDFTVANAGSGRFFVFGSGIAEQYHLRWFEAHLPRPGVAIRSLRTELLGLRHRRDRGRASCCRALTGDDVSNAALPFLSFRAMDVGDAAGARRPHLVHRRARLRDLGARRLPACAVRRDRSPRAPISDCGTSARARSIRCASRRASATGRANTGRSTRPRRRGSIASSMSRRRISSAATRCCATASAGPARRLVTFVVDATEADAIGDEPVWHDGKVVGWITSGGYGHCVGKSIALGYVPAAVAAASVGLRDRDARRAPAGVARAAAAARSDGRAHAAFMTARPPWWVVLGVPALAALALYAPVLATGISRRRFRAAARVRRLRRRWRDRAVRRADVHLRRGAAQQSVPAADDGDLSR